MRSQSPCLRITFDLYIWIFITPAQKMKRNPIRGPGDVLCSCRFVVRVLLSVFFLFFFSLCVVMLALWSPYSVADHFAFCFTSCVVMLVFWPPLTAADFAFCFTSD